MVYKGKSRENPQSKMDDEMGYPHLSGHPHKMREITDKTRLMPCCHFRKLLKTVGNLSIPPFCQFFDLGTCGEILQYMDDAKSSEGPQAAHPSTSCVVEDYALPGLEWQNDP